MKALARISIKSLWPLVLKILILKVLIWKTRVALKRILRWVALT